MYDIAIIGAGVVGAAVARELSKYELRILIVDKENDACFGTSKANSGIVHAGYDPPPGSLMAKLNTRANPMFDDLCSELSVPMRRIGSLVIAFDDEQLETINKLRARGLQNGISDLRILSEEELKEREPNISPYAKAALLAKTGGIVDPMLLTYSLLENAVFNGCDTIFNFEVKSIEKNDSAWLLSSNTQSVLSKVVINAAGLYADIINNMASIPSFEITPVRGEYFLLDKSEFGKVNSVIFPCPTKAGKGILVSPTAHGNVIIGPTSDKIQNKDDVSTNEDTLDKVISGARLLIPGLNIGSIIRSFSGLRADGSTGDFIVEEAFGAANFINVAGIKSPGLTAAPAIAEHVVAILKKKEISLIPKHNFEPSLKRELLIDMTEREQKDLISQNSLYGRVICRCENITEGDIVDAIRRDPGARSIDGVKLRCRAGMGRCQSGFCGPKVQEILARETGRSLEDVPLNKKSSYILIGRTK